MNRMGNGHFMEDPDQTHGETDPRRVPASGASETLAARDKLAEAIRAAMPEDRPPGLVADLAVWLARRGHAKTVSVKVTDTDEAVQAVRSFFAERLQADPTKTASDTFDTRQCVHGGSASGASVHKRTRACAECGQEFRVNPCHAETHRCCRPACRARRHRRLRGIPRGGSRG